MQAKNQLIKLKRVIVSHYNPFTLLFAPSDAVATEYFNDGTIYRKEDSIQKISNSTWFELGKYDLDEVFYEYCIVTPKYNTVLSLVWQ